MRRQRGFGAIAAIMVLVILAALAAAIVSLGTTQQASSALDVMSTRAWQAARAGNEYGLFRALSTTTPADAWKTCAAAGDSTTLDLTADTGFHVTVTCSSWLYNEGEAAPGVAQPVRMFRIRAIACPVAAGCTGVNDGSGTYYVERTRTVIATNIATD
jgi:MSHA biogenesis protein MshP